MTGVLCDFMGHRRAALLFSGLITAGQAIFYLGVLESRHVL
jgi:hypothetical protein